MKKRKWWRKCNGEVKSSGGGKEAKREEKGWRKRNHRHVLIKWGEEESSYEKWWRKCNGEVESSGGGKEAKREGKS